MQFKTLGGINGRTEVNKYITITPISNVKKQILNAEQDGKLLYYNLKNQSSSVGNRAQFPTVNTQIDYEFNIEQFWNNFKAQRKINEETINNASSFNFDDIK